MSYKKAADVLPEEVIEIIQKYVDGEYIYIPRKEDNRKPWGENTKSKELLLSRNIEIYKKHAEGMSVQFLSESYYLSPKTIQKIIAKIKLNSQ